MLMLFCTTHKVIFSDRCAVRVSIMLIFSFPWNQSKTDCQMLSFQETSSIPACRRWENKHPEVKMTKANEQNPGFPSLYRALWSSSCHQKVCNGPLGLSLFFSCNYHSQIPADPFSIKIESCFCEFHPISNYFTFYRLQIKPQKTRLLTILCIIRSKPSCFETIIINDTAGLTSIDFKNMHDLLKKIIVIKLRQHCACFQ